MTFWSLGLISFKGHLTVKCLAHAQYLCLSKYLKSLSLGRDRGKVSATNEEVKIWEENRDALLLQCDGGTRRAKAEKNGFLFAFCQTPPVYIPRTKTHFFIMVAVRILV